MIELLGRDLLEYAPATPQDLNLLYEWITPVVADFLEEARAGRLVMPEFDLRPSRNAYRGEVLVVSAKRDHVYGPEIGRGLSQAYPNSRWAVFDDTHRMMTHPAFYSRFRRAFFEHGLHSRELDQLMVDPRQLNLE